MISGTNKEKQQPGSCELVNKRFSMKIPKDWENRSYYLLKGPANGMVKHKYLLAIDNNVNVPFLEQGDVICGLTADSCYV